MNGDHHLPIIEAKTSSDCRSVPFAPMSSSPPNSRSSTSASTSSTISRDLFFKHRGHGEALRRPFARSSCRRGRAGIRRWNRRTCARLLRGRGARRGLRGAGSRPSASGPAGGAGASLQPSALPRPSLPHHDAQGRRSPGQAARGAGQAIERAADRKPLSAQHARPRRLAPRSGPGQVAWRGAREPLRMEFVAYVDRLEASESHLDRLITTGLLPKRVAFDQGATGPMERASGFDRDLRRDHPYAHYAELPLRRHDVRGGDAYARERVRIAEVEAAFALVPTRSAVARAGPKFVPIACARRFRKDSGWAEGPRGSLFYAVHVDEPTEGSRGSRSSRLRSRTGAHFPSPCTTRT